MLHAPFLPCFLPHYWHASYPILTMLSYPKSGMVHAPFIPCFLTPYLAWITYHDSPSFMVSIRDNTGMVSGVHFGMDLGHDSWSRIETKLHGFWGDCKGGFWHGFDVNFGVNFEKEFAYLFRHPRVRAHV